jgi:hypothetical protein
VEIRDVSERGLYRSNYWLFSGEIYAACQNSFGSRLAVKCTPALKDLPAMMEMGVAFAAENDFTELEQATAPERCYAGEARH